MAEQMQPSSKDQAPDPSNTYERSHPENEAGMGRLDTNTNSTPTPNPDSGIKKAVINKQDNRQVNAHDVVNERASATPVAPDQPDHSMLEEEPDGWDMAPNDISDPRQKRHPRTEGKGGTP